MHFVRSFSAVLLTLVHTATIVAETPADRASSAAKLLQSEYYVQSSGLWKTASWWASANCLQALADLAHWCPPCGTALNFPSIASNTYKNAPAHGGKNFINKYYDDEGWWALAWIRAYDVTKNKDYLKTATVIFNDMVSTGANATCGGIWWRKSEPKENTAIANAIFISIAAHLANRQPNKSYYYKWAKKNLDWFEGAGFLKRDNRVQDSLDVKNGCKPIGAYWTYNHGVILGALVEMNKASSDAAYLTKAQAIADLATTYFTDKQGILHELWDNNTKKYPFPVGRDGMSFKGVFMRNLAVLQRAQGSVAYKEFINRQAESIWKNKAANGSIGVNFAGPFNMMPMAAQQGVGLDALAAAVAVNPGVKSIPSVPPFRARLAPSTSSKKPISASATTKSVSTHASASNKSTSATFYKVSKTTGTSTSGTAKPLSKLKLVICPVGDSITAGIGSKDNNGYRAELQKLLQAQGASVRMIGSRRGGGMANNQHEGYSGYTIVQIEGSLTQHKALKINRDTNLVLLFAGTNDMDSSRKSFNATGAPERLHHLIGVINQQDPTAVIIVAPLFDVVGNAGRTTRHRVFNAGAKRIVQKITATKPKIRWASQDEWLTASEKKLFKDGLHPNDIGYKRMARLWYENIEKLAEEGVFDEKYGLSASKSSKSTSSRTVSAKGSSLSKASSSGKITNSKVSPSSKVSAAKTSTLNSTSLTEDSSTPKGLSKSTAAKPSKTPKGKVSSTSSNITANAFSSETRHDTQTTSTSGTTKRIKSEPVGKSSSAKSRCKKASGSAKAPITSNPSALSKSTKTANTQEKTGKSNPAEPLTTKTLSSSVYEVQVTEISYETHKTSATVTRTKSTYPTTIVSVRTTTQINGDSTSVKLVTSTHVSICTEKETVTKPISVTEAFTVARKYTTTVEPEPKMSKAVPVPQKKQAATATTCASAKQSGWALNVPTEKADWSAWGHTLGHRVKRWWSFGDDGPDLAMDGLDAASLSNDEIGDEREHSVEDEVGGEEGKFEYREDIGIGRMAWPFGGDDVADASDEE